ncbi:alpha/beta fold hydrolase [Streptomyces sp. NPDC059118]|uniref:alpha/beta fold hydrolase n=1 Tax=unclassified Streptomyces TaxID=2593676 RepID=UPI0036A433E4
MVHGTRFSAGQWSPQLASLQEEFRVATVDLPGHGTRSAQPWSLNAATEIIASAVDSLDCGPALVVGHSLGGYASLKFARRCPEQLRGLVLAGASASTRGPWATPYRWAPGSSLAYRRTGWHGGTAGCCAGSILPRWWSDHPLRLRLPHPASRLGRGAGPI